MTREYYEYPALAEVYLEDSYVLQISDTSGSVRFVLDAVLKPGHPAYREPLPGEEYCYVRAELVFVDVSKTDWISRSSQTYRDATGEEDLGNIDSFVNSGAFYELEGDWGKVHIWTVADPQFSLLH
ncbi:hypothetical protein [Nocardia cerradoensis]|uniref:hypothetical protein n=1 Tax=Nocardia cerradoensis TaxID=85688 RepID=UPI000B8B798E|nr:hypothetical protein [Nocardia cerradoensis]